MPRSNQSNPTDAPARQQEPLADTAPAEARRRSMQDILALNGLGSISITPRQDAAQPLPAGIETVALPNEPGADAIPIGANTTPEHPRKPEHPRIDGRAQDHGAHETHSTARQPTSAQRNSQRLRKALSRRLTEKKETANPGVQRLIEPIAVSYQPPKPHYEHVKLAALKQNSGSGGGEAKSKASVPSRKTNSVPAPNPSPPLGNAGPPPMRHMPPNVQDKLRAFTGAAPKPPQPRQSDRPGDHESPPLTQQHAGPLPSPDPNQNQSPSPNSSPDGSQPQRQPSATQTSPEFEPSPSPTHPHPLSSGATGSELRAALYASKRAFIAAGIFSMVINLLMLTGPIFMLQVYDRVMASGSIPTLVVLFAMTVMLYLVLGLLELARSRIIVRIGVDVDRRIGARVFQAAIQRSVTTPESSAHIMRELEHLRSFIAGPGPLTFFDAPWTPIYLIIIFALHWLLGVAAAIGGAGLVALALFSEYRSRAVMQEATLSAAASLDLAQSGQQGAQTITALGMMGAYRSRWQAANRQSLAWQVLVADRLGSSSAWSKSLRLAMQSTMLAIGAALAVSGQISAGTIVAASIIFGRALSPVEQAIGQWRSFARAREAYERLNELLRECPEPRQTTALPRPKGQLDVDNLKVAARDTRTLILSNLNFSIAPGQVLAVIGPSAAGKSTLARALVGLWPPMGGCVRLDGARLDQWPREELGKHIGYLPQCVELFPGTVRDNIARFQEDANDEAVIAAAQMAHAHELITALPQGYDTKLGTAASFLSGGQRQRIALARALYGNPAFIVMDEPNANLDRLGDEALDRAIAGMRERGQTIVLISHRVGALARADFVLYIDKGVQRAFGPYDEVMQLLQCGKQPARPSPMQREQQQTTANTSLQSQSGQSQSGQSAPHPAARANWDQEAP